MYTNPRVGALCEKSRGVRIAGVIYYLSYKAAERRIYSFPALASNQPFTPPRSCSLATMISFHLPGKFLMTWLSCETSWSSRYRGSRIIVIARAVKQTNSLPMLFGIVYCDLKLWRDLLHYLISTATRGNPVLL
jgi:hypothetical protein